MNIGIYLGYRFPVDLAGAGAGRHIFRLAEGLLRERPESNLLIVAMPANITQTAKMFFRLKTNFPGRVAVYCADDPDWINANVPAELWLVPWVGMESARYLTKPLVVCLHDLAYVHFPELKDLGRRVDGAAKMLTYKAAAVICNCEYIRMADAFNYLRLPAEKTHVVRPAPPVEEYADVVLPDERDFREHYRLDKKYFAFPSVASLPHKNHLRLIEAFLRFKQAQTNPQAGPYLVFTDHIENFCQKSELSSLIIQFAPALVGDVIFLGRLPAADVTALYKYAAGTVVPSLFEGGCPFPIQESLIMGTPVAFGRIAMAMEAIPDIRAFITFDAHDVADMQRALGELWDSDKNVAASQKAALGAFIERTWRDVAREYYAVIDRILGWETPVDHEEKATCMETAVAVTDENAEGTVQQNAIQNYMQTLKTVMQNIRLKL